MHCTFVGFFRSLRMIITHPISAYRGDLGLEWLDEDTQYQCETKLSDDLKTLRMLEAEIYSLNDQINTNPEHDSSLVL